MNNDNRNLILALVLMTAVWFAFSCFFSTQPPQPPAPTPDRALVPGLGEASEETSTVNIWI